MATRTVSNILGIAAGIMFLIILGAGSNSGGDCCDCRPYEEKVKEQTVELSMQALERTVNVPDYSNTEGLRG